MERQEPSSTEGKRQPHDWNELLDGPWNNGFLSTRITMPSAGAAPRQPVAKDVNMVASTRDRKNRPPFDWNELVNGPWKPSEEIKPADSGFDRATFEASLEKSFQ